MISALESTLIARSMLTLCLPVCLGPEGAIPFRTSHKPADTAIAVDTELRIIDIPKTLRKKSVYPTGTTITPIEKVCYLQTYLDICAQRPDDPSPVQRVPLANMPLNVDTQHSVLLRPATTVTNFFHNTVFKGCVDTPEARIKVVKKALDDLLKGVEVNAETVRSRALAELKSICGQGDATLSRRAADLREGFSRVWQSLRKAQEGVTQEPVR